jgi:hypothetical protein
MSLRTIAIDWSGAKIGAARKIWLAEARNGELLRLEPGRDREEIVAHLIELARTGERFVVGLDFGFSFPAWFLRQQGFRSAPDAWRWLAGGDRADALLNECAAPFWGRVGTRRPPPDAQFRRTETAVAAAERVHPKSIFQIGGAGAVGTGSVRGMCALHALRKAGIAIWPFDEAATKTAVEIYPRLFTGPTNKSSVDARRARLADCRASMRRPAFAAACGSDDAFDAAISAIEMSKHAGELAALPPVDDPQFRLEGIIWWPRWREAHGLV